MNMLTFNFDPFMTHVFPLKSVKLHAFPLLLIHAAYNAIWNPEEGSVTRFLQCKGCLSQSPAQYAALIAAEIKYPRDIAQDQVNFINVNKCENVYVLKTLLIQKNSWGCLEVPTLPVLGFIVLSVDIIMRSIK